MTKAILVLSNLPKDCSQCRLASLYRPDCYCYCMALKKEVPYNHIGYREMDPEYGDWRWDKCPLKELPEPEINNYITDEDWECLPDDYEISTAYAVGHQNGWNECLDAIGGTKD